MFSMWLGGAGGWNSLDQRGQWRRVECVGWFKASAARWGAGGREGKNYTLSCLGPSQVNWRLYLNIASEKNRNHDQNFNLNPKSSYDYTSTFIQVSLFFKHGAEPSDAASARVAGLKVSGPRSRPWGCCHFFTLIASLDTRCFEDEDVFTEGAVKGSRGKLLPFSLKTGRSVFSVESCRQILQLNIWDLLANRIMRAYLYSFISSISKFGASC